MKKIILIFAILFSTTMLSSNSFGEWKFLTSTVSGDNIFIDNKRIRKHDGYVYFWVLEDLLKPDQDGDLSYINYFQGDCNLFRYKHLSASYYKQAMGQGTVKNLSAENPKWKNTISGSVMEDNFKFVCGM